MSKNEKLDGIELHNGWDETMYKVVEKKVAPIITSCWFCSKLEPEEDMVFDVEFDTMVHTQCIEAALKRDPNHPEAKHMKYLLD